MIELEFYGAAGRVTGSCHILRVDGRTVLLDIKADPALADIPVVVLTTSDNQEDIDYCLQNVLPLIIRNPAKSRTL